MQQKIFSPENPEGVTQVYTTEQEAEVKTFSEAQKVKIQAEKDAKTAKETLKASAKAKLIAGEALTEDEANTIVL